MIKWLIALVLAQAAGAATPYSYDTVAKLQGNWMNSAREATAYRVEGDRIVRGIASGVEGVGFVMISDLRFERTQAGAGYATQYFKGLCRRAFDMPSGVEVRQYPDCWMRIYEVAPFRGNGQAASQYGFTGRRENR